MAWLVCLSAGLFFFYEFFQLNIFDVINQSLRNDFQLNATQLSWMSSTYLWANILFLLPAGLILDRYSTRKVIIIALSVCVIGTFGFAISHNFALASFTHFLSGIGNAFCFLSCVVLVSQWFSSNKQALVIGSIVTMAFLGGMMAHSPFAYLVDNQGWRNAMLINGMFGLVILAWISFIIKDQPLGSEDRKRPFDSSLLLCLKETISNKQTWLPGLYTSFLNLPIMVLCALWGASYLHKVHGLSEISASTTVSFIFIGSIIGCPLAGWMSDTSGRRKPLMIVGAIVSFIVLIPLFLNIHLSQTQLNSLFFALGLFTSTQVISYPLIAESNRSHNTGVATGLASIIIMGGGGVGQVLFGWLVQKSAGIDNQSYSAADFQYAMWMFPITAIAALIAVWFTRETYCKQLRSLDANGK
jgi:MFS family permease